MAKKADSLLTKINNLQSGANKNSHSLWCLVVSYAASAIGC